MADDLPPQFREPKRPEPRLYEELPAELPEEPPPAEELPPRAPELFLRREGVRSSVSSFLFAATRFP
ncbi:MAG TPA: hypothetical protein VI670_17530 [Thermoanaerobaculia bacterium]